MWISLFWFPQSPVQKPSFPSSPPGVRPPEVTPWGNFRVRSYHIQAPVTGLKYYGTKIFGYHNNTVESEIRSAAEAESQVERACVKAERERRSAETDSEGERGKHETFGISSFGGRSAVNLGLVLASRQAWQEAPSQNARLYNSHLSLSVFDSLEVLSRHPSPLFCGCDVVVFSRKRRLQLAVVMRSRRCEWLRAHLRVEAVLPPPRPHWIRHASSSS